MILTQAHDLAPFGASKATPCPLCGREHYCWLIPGGNGEIAKAVCQWTDEAPGWDKTGIAKDGRPIFSRHGARGKRNIFPDFILLDPQPKPGIPEWQLASQSIDQAKAGDRVFLATDPATPYTLTKIEGRQYRGAQTLFAILSRAENSLGGIVEMPLAELGGIYRHDPRNDGQEYEIEYLYPDIEGKPLGRVARRQWSDRRPWYDRDYTRTKQIRPAHWVGGVEDGYWSEKGKGDRPWLLYREGEAKEAIAGGGLVFVVAGEQAVEAYRGLGLTATTCQGGESNWRIILERLKDSFAIAKENDRRPCLIIHPDYDITGDDKFSALLKECQFSKIPAVLLNPLHLWEQMPPGGDIFDFIKDSQFTANQMLRQIENAIDKAIDHQEVEMEARKQRDRWQAPDSYRGELGFWREDKETERRYFRPMADWDFQVERELKGADGGGLLLQVKLADIPTQFRVFIKSADSSTPQKFLDALKKAVGHVMVCNLPAPALQALIRARISEYRTTRQGKSYRLVDRVGQQPDGAWVFGDRQFDKHGEPTMEEKSLWVWNPEVTGNDAHFSPPKIHDSNPNPLRELVAIMQRAFGSNFFPAMLAMGYAAAGTHYQEIQAKEGAFPILNLYGDPGSGKTTVAECVLSVVGQHREGMMVEVSVSAAYERLKLAGGLLHCLDDPKRDAHLDEFLKGFYNGKARVVRGKDADGFNTQRPHSPLMVTSNHACGENSAATQSRLVRLFFAKVNDGDRSAFLELSAAQERASACFSDLVKLGYPAAEVHALEQELAVHLPQAHVRIAKSLALLLFYSLKVAAIAGVDGVALKRYVIERICSQVNDPDESGDSLRDFFEKVHVLQSLSKVGDWNARWIEKEGQAKVFAIHLPGVWKALDSEFKVSYNRKIIESLLQANGITKTRQNFHKSEDESRAFHRANLTASENFPPRPPEKINSWCYELPEEFVREYSEKASGEKCQRRSTGSTAPSDEALNPATNTISAVDLLNQREINGGIDNPHIPEPDLPVDLLPVDISSVDLLPETKMSTERSASSNGFSPLEGAVDLVDLKNAEAPGCVQDFPGVTENTRTPSVTIALASPIQVGDPCGISVGARVRYIGKNFNLQRICGDRLWTVAEIENEIAICSRSAKPPYAPEAGRVNPRSPLADLKKIGGKADAHDS